MAVAETQIWSPSSQFQGISEKTADNQICHMSFKVMKFPDEKRFLTNNRSRSSTKDFMLFY